ncbi:RAD9, HUS1, RAD1-interacting nuclear orphan protein 1-like [Antechinus flavipes]|uniref:RAD9, HUS1, RAD1-interacting nuclear orphan protein 1-like n=1 Tax=Antechinus flavipes TaxID=38775 RepID=UPI00223640AA|nr:RAD9, HUS1, RAD1-interacting nuclear orphan protein 1-like [Antechinus flavipes]
MPRRKKSNSPSRKAQLSFLERPLEGPKLGGGSPRPCPAPSRIVPRRPINPEARLAWVSPQFKKPPGSWLPVGRKPQPPSRRSLPFQVGGSSRRRRRRWRRFHWLPPLPLKSLHHGPGTNPGSETSFREASTRQNAPRLDGAEEAGRPPTLPPNPRSCDPLQPDPLDKIAGLRVATSDVAATSRDQGLGHCPLNLDRPQTPPSCQPPLVVDTPEEKYGVKVTWRRRFHLVSYLRERGKLSLNQIFVSKSGEALKP